MALELAQVLEFSIESAADQKCKKDISSFLEEVLSKVLLAPLVKNLSKIGVIFNILEIVSRIRKTIQNSPGSSAGLLSPHQNCGRVATVAVVATHACAPARPKVLPQV